MRLSYSLKKNILETYVGGIINKFKIKKRRDVLFFEDILANYIKECGKAGYSKEMEKIGQKWMNLGVQQVVPEIFKKTPLFFLNKIMKKVWINLGLMDNLHIIKKDNLIKIETKNEGITRIIGKNHFTVGLFTGILNVLFKSEIECVDFLQTKKFCEYSFKIKNKPFHIQSKEKELYNKLNQFLQIKGFSLKDSLQKHIFQLKQNNRVYFRGKLVSPMENTLFHLISNQDILLEKVPSISYEYFNKIIKERTTKERKLYLLKTILESMGWGIVKIAIGKKKILFKIENPPYGLQLEKDNWKFLAKIILGYLRLLDKNFKIVEMVTDHPELSIVYSS